MTDPSIKDAIRAATDIGQLMLEYTERGRKTPDGFVVKCPAHREKTESCHVHVRGARAGSWKCFGCSAGGDCFDLVMVVNGWTEKQFGKAVEFLAERAGISTELQPGAEPVRKKTAVEYREIAAEREFCEWWSRRRVEQVKVMLDAAVAETDSELNVRYFGISWDMTTGKSELQELGSSSPAYAAAERFGAEYRRLGGLGPTDALVEFRMLATKADRKAWDAELKGRGKLKEHVLAILKCLGDNDEALDRRIACGRVGELRGGRDLEHAEIARMIHREFSKSYPWIYQGMSI